MMMDNKKFSKNPKIGKKIIFIILYVDDLALKNFLNLNGNLLEIMKTSIKQKNNDIVLKMMDTINDKPEVWFEYLSVIKLNNF
jgi:hypothetical protein